MSVSPIEQGEHVFVRLRFLMSRFKAVERELTAMIVAHDLLNRCPYFSTRLAGALGRRKSGKPIGTDAGAIVARLERVRAKIARASTGSAEWYEFYSRMTSSLDAIGREAQARLGLRFERYRF